MKNLGFLLIFLFSAICGNSQTLKENNVFQDSIVNADTFQHIFYTRNFTHDYELWVELDTISTSGANGGLYTLSMAKENGENYHPLDTFSISNVPQLFKFTGSHLNAKYKIDGITTGTSSKVLRSHMTIRPKP